LILAAAPATIRAGGVMHAALDKAAEKVVENVIEGVVLVKEAAHGLLR